MVAIKLTATIGEDRRLVIDLPENTPLGEVDVEIEVKSTSERVGALDSSRLTPERAREMMQQAGVLSHYAIPDIQPLSENEMLALGTPAKDSPSTLDLINEDRGAW